jgi:hypothetical protein
MKYLLKFEEINESLPRQNSVEQLKNLRKLTKGIDIGDRIENDGSNMANSMYSRNIIDSGIESYSDFEKHNKKFQSSWNLKNMLSPFSKS